MVRRVEVDRDRVDVAFRIPPPHTPGATNALATSPRHPAAFGKIVEAAIVGLVGALMLEVSDEWAAARAPRRWRPSPASCRPIPQASPRRQPDRPGPPEGRRSYTARWDTTWGPGGCG